MALIIITYSPIHLTKHLISGISMTDFSDIAHNKNRFRAACKNLSVKQMQTMAEHLAEFIEKRAEEEAASLAQDAKKAAEKQAILSAMADAGLSPEDFVTNETPKTKKARKPVAPQYRIKDANGETHEWSGRGRTPKVFEHYFNTGGSKDSCRI